MEELTAQGTTSILLTCAQRPVDRSNRRLYVSGKSRAHSPFASRQDCSSKVQVFKPQIDRSLFTRPIVSHSECATNPRR